MAKRPRPREIYIVLSGDSPLEEGGLSATIAEAMQLIRDNLESGDDKTCSLLTYSLTSITEYAMQIVVVDKKKGEDEIEQEKPKPKPKKVQNATFSSRRRKISLD